MKVEKEKKRKGKAKGIRENKNCVPKIRKKKGGEQTKHHTNQTNIQVALNTGKTKTKGEKESKGNTEVRNEYQQENQTTNHMRRNTPKHTTCKKLEMAT